MKEKEKRDKVLGLLSEKEKKILFWDYYPEKLKYLKILQRIAEFFPSYGRKPLIIKELYENRENLRLERDEKAIIELYYQVLLEVERERGYK